MFQKAASAKHHQERRTKSETEVAFPRYTIMACIRGEQLMWARNLLFVGVVSAGLVALAVAFFPPRLPDRLRHVDLSATRDAEFRASASRVDDAFARQWRDLEIMAAPPASELTVMRRLNLALTGSIPSLEEIRQFEAYAGEDRLHWWLAGLLQERRFADYLAERLARVYVGTEDGPFLVYRRRRFASWLSDQIYANRPYDQFVRELIASEGLWTDKPATNFVTVTIDQTSGNAPNPERLAARVARAFLGVRLDCAQCHNHPFQKWKQADFRGLAAFFGQAEQGFTGIHDGDGELRMEDRRTGAMETIVPRVPFLSELLPTAGSRRSQLAEWLTARENPYFSRVTVNRVWALLFGRPLVEPVDDLASAEEMPVALPLLADDFAAHGYDLRRLIQLVVSLRVFQLDSAADFEITDAHEKAWASFPMSRLRPEQMAGSVQQAGSVTTISQDSHVLWRIIRAAGENEFVKRYGDTGEDEFDARGGTIPQRLLLMNGTLVKENTKAELLTASGQIGMMAPNDRAAVENAFLGVLTRRATLEEAAYFEARLQGTAGDERQRCMEDLYWTLLNSTEFSWNH